MLNISALRVIYHGASVFVRINLHTKDMMAPKFKNGSRDSDHAHLR